MGNCFGKKKFKPGQNSSTSVQTNQIPPEKQSRARLSVLVVEQEEVKDFAKQLENQQGDQKQTQQRQSRYKPGKQNNGKQNAQQVPKGRLIVSGKPSNRRQQGFDEKLVRLEGAQASKDYLNSLGIAFKCKKGLKPESPNQDDFCIIIEDNTVVLCVFDGHGPYGHDVSNYVHEHLPKALLSHPTYHSDPLKSLNECFTRINSKLHNECTRYGFNCDLSGTTATIGILRDNRLYIAHCGDSRAVLASRSAGELIARRLTPDHKPKNEDEKKRIEANGGEVKQLEGDIPHRIFKRGEMFPGLAMSRAIGDYIAQNLGVIATPDLCEVELSEADQYLILCSDGVWEFINDQEAVNLVERAEGNVNSAADKLSALAWTRWLKNEEDVVDDITVIVAALPLEINQIKV